MSSELSSGLRFWLRLLTQWREMGRLTQRQRLPAPDILRCHGEKKAVVCSVKQTSIASMWSEDFCLSTNLLIFPQRCGFTLSCLSELVYSRPICGRIASQRALRSVWRKSPPFFQTYHKVFPTFCNGFKCTPTSWQPFAH